MGILPSLRGANRGSAAPASVGVSSGPIPGFAATAAGKLSPLRISPSRNQELFSRNNSKRIQLFGRAQEQLGNPPRVVEFQNAQVEPGCRLLRRLWIERYAHGIRAPIQNQLRDLKTGRQLNRV